MKQRWNLRRVHGVTLRDKVRSCEIPKALNVERLWICRSQLRWFGHVSRMSHEISARRVLLATPTGKRPSGPLRVDQGSRGMTASPTLLGPVLVWSSGAIWDCTNPWDIWSPPRATAPAKLPRGKEGTKMNEWMM